MLTKIMTPLQQHQKKTEEKFEKRFSFDDGDGRVWDNKKERIWGGDETSKEIIAFIKSREQALAKKMEEKVREKALEDIFTTDQVPDYIPVSSKFRKRYEELLNTNKK